MAMTRLTLFHSHTAGTSENNNNYLLSATGERRCHCTTKKSTVRHTSGKQAGHWILTWQSTNRLSETVDVSATAIAEHVFAAGHQVDLSKVTVMDTQPHAQTCCLLVSWNIQHEQAPLNRGKGNFARTLCHLVGLTAH